MEDLVLNYFEDLKVGRTAVYSKTVTDADIVLFAGVTGDTNPIHLDEQFAASTVFKTRIAHGMLSAGMISTVLGTRLPGPGCVYMTQNLKFKAPVKIGETVVAKVEITELFPEKKRVALRTTCWVGDTLVIDGDALLMVPARG
ncbi:MAG TPA: MaoC family dehydratase [Rhodospirillaceae bacterium]|nr:MaoC family dehydratase [Rhodospirillaceae bacterium]